MIWHNHINLTIEHHKIRQAYRGSCSRNSIEVNYSDEEKEEDDDNDGLDNGDGTPQSKDVKKTTERQLHARAQIRYAEVEEEECSEKITSHYLSRIGHVKKRLWGRTL